MTSVPTRQRMVILVVAILGAALAMRVGYVLLTWGYKPRYDDAAFDYLARGIAKTGAYPDIAHRATAYRPPAFSYFLGGIYAISGLGHARIVTARIFQSMVGVGLVALLGLLARRLFGSRVALITMVVAAVYPSWVTAGTSLLSEPLSIGFEVGSILAVLGWRRDRNWGWVVLAGALGGALALTRSNGVVVIIALAVGVWTVRPRLSSAALKPVFVLLGTAAVVVAPWTIRNAVVLHSFIPVSDEDGGTLAGTYNPVSAHDKVAPAYWHLLDQIPTYETATRHASRGPEPQFQDRLLHLAADYVHAHPFYPAKVAYWNTVRLLDLNGVAQSRYTARLSGITSPSVADATIYGFWIVAAVALVGLVGKRVRSSVPAFVWLAALLLFASVVLINSETPRLRMPLDPFVILLAGAGLANLGDRRSI